MFGLVMAGLVMGAALAGKQGGPDSYAAILLATAASALAAPAAASVLMLYCGYRARKSPDAWSQPGFWSLASVHPKAMQAISILHLGAYAASLTLFGWAGLPVRLRLGEWGFPSGVIIAAPFILSLVLSWIPIHYAESQLRRRGPTLLQQMSFNLRQYVLTLCVPMGIILGVADLVRLAFGNEIEESWVYAAVMLPILVAGYTFAPVVLVRLWITSRLPESPVRERLLALCDRIKVGCREIMIWEAPGLQFVNAAVMGVVSRFRYIVVSRNLLEMLPPEGVEAVFAHELGHARRHHMPYYVLFVANCFLVANLVHSLLGASLFWDPDTYFLVAAGAMLALVGLGFGALSRTFEREADLFGADTCGNVETFTTALESISWLNGTNPSSRSWRHGSIASRVEFLRAAAAPDSPARRMFLARVEFVKVFLIALCASALAAVALVTFAL